MCMYGLLVSML